MIATISTAAHCQLLSCQMFWCILGKRLLKKTLTWFWGAPTIHLGKSLQSLEFFPW
jgi:hypothetical protein